MPDLTGPLVIIGGHEDKENARVILKEVASHLRGSRLVIATVASHEPEGYFDSYREAFTALGINDLVEVYVEERAESFRPELLDAFEGAGGVFFTGGDQLRITSQIGDTPLEERIRDLNNRGGVIAGTSAGASVMSETMLVRGASSESYRIGELHMAPGLGLMKDAIIDQHFAERGRHGRLIGAVAHNPRLLGIGIDEDTAIVVSGSCFKVIGSGAIYLIDGGNAVHSNIAEAKAERALSLFGVQMHVLSSGDRFDLKARKPTPGAHE